MSIISSWDLIAHTTIMHINFKKLMVDIVNTKVDGAKNIILYITCVCVCVCVDLYHWDGAC